MQRFPLQNLRNVSSIDREIWAQPRAQTVSIPGERESERESKGVSINDGGRKHGCSINQLLESTPVTRSVCLPLSLWPVGGLKRSKGG